MKDVDEIRKRLQKRKENHTLLSDRMFKRFYNTMIKFMVVLVVGLFVFSYSRSNSLVKLYEDVFNTQHLQTVVQWVKTTLYDDVVVSSSDVYQELGQGMFSSYLQGIECLEKGKVIYIGDDYVTVLLESNVQVTYGLMDTVDVILYQSVNQYDVIGTYNEAFSMALEYLGETIDYETYKGMD